MREPDAGLTPRERQIALETARLDNCVVQGHTYVHGDNECVFCGEPYPVVAVDWPDYSPPF